MNILFIGYWNLDDPLTASTIFPHLKILKSLREVNNVYFCNVQREDTSEKSLTKLQELEVQYYPLKSKISKLSFLEKLFDFIISPIKIAQIAKKKNIDLIIARGAPTGGLAYLSSKIRNIPFIVESYEPHSIYMLESQVWSKKSWKYIIQHSLENKVNKYAYKLITVSYQFKNFLIEKGVNKSKIYVNPCGVDLALFKKAESPQVLLKEKLNIPKNAIIGVYAGKFGGLYYEEEIFQLIKTLNIFFKKNLYFILLSNYENDKLDNMIKSYGLNPLTISKLYVAHDQVNSYLNLADFAIAPYKSTNSSKYLSPVKLAEYWACNLPVILSENVGDEHIFLEEKKLGVTIDFNKLNLKEYTESKLELIKQLIHGDKSHIREFASQNRNFLAVKSTYSSIINEQINAQ